MNCSNVNTTSQCREQLSMDTTTNAKTCEFYRANELL